MPSLFSVATAHDQRALSGPVISRDASFKTSMLIVQVTARCLMVELCHWIVRGQIFPKTMCCVLRTRCNLNVFVLSLFLLVSVDTCPQRASKLRLVKDYWQSYGHKGYMALGHPYTSTCHPRAWKTTLETVPDSALLVMVETAHPEH